MFTKIIMALFAISFMQQLSAASNEDIAQIREQIQQMKKEYETRIQALEARLKNTEVAEKSIQKNSSMPSNTGAFNPEMSLILSGLYTNLSKDPARHQITGFVPTGGEVSPGNRGFSLTESELIIAANIDHLFRGQLTAAITPENEIEIEEAFFQTLGLSHGLSLKGGRFFSGIGYLNEKHAHAWDFVDAPLPYKAFLGGQLGDDGLQLKWLAPTPVFLELGAELSRGKNFPSTNRDKNGVGSHTVFAHVGDDWGTNSSWRAGLSYLQTSPKDRTYTDTNSVGDAVSNTFNGRNRLAILDGVWKWSPNGNPYYTNFKLQGEYFWNKQAGNLTYDDTASSNAFGSLTNTFNTKQSGWYLQSVYQWQPQWRVGLRYDRLHSGTIANGIVNNATGPSAADFGVLSPYNPSRTTLMFDYNASEFSRIRLQFAQDKSRRDATDNQIFLQYLFSLGAHGGHKF